MQEGSAAQRAAVRQCRSPFGGVENQLNFAVFDGVNDMRSALGDLVYLHSRDTLLGEVSLCSGRCQHFETESSKQPRRFEDAPLVGVAHRDEYGSGFRHSRTAAELAFREGDVERAVEAHDLAGRL